MRIGVREIRRVSFSSDSASAFVASVVPIHTRSERSSDSDSASFASVASVNKPEVNVVTSVVSWEDKIEVENTQQSDNTRASVTLIALGNCNGFP